MSVAWRSITKLDWHNLKLRLESFESHLWERGLSIDGNASAYKTDVLEAGVI